MQIWVCGVRGSTPAPGAQFVRFGGNTSCVAVAHDGEPPSLILDAGTGIRQASDLFGAAPGLFGGLPFRGSIVLGHLHWDHTQGLPFFGAGNQEGSSVDLYVPDQGDAQVLVDGFLSPPYFPITSRQLLGDWRLQALASGSHTIGDFKIEALEIPHTAGRTFGLRVSDGRNTIAYLSDHCPTMIGPGADGLGAHHASALALTRDCDLVFHDAQYTDAELPTRAHFGHASTGYAVGLARAAGAREVLLYHHDPSRTDDALDALEQSYAGLDITVRAACEGMVIPLS